MSIRMATIEDIPQILDIYRPYVENTAISSEYTVPSLYEFHQRFLKTTAQYPWLVWEEKGAILGYTYASRPLERAAYQWSASASIYLRPDAKGKGIGRKLYAALEQLLQLQGYRKVYAIITTVNEDSIAFHQAVGYRQAAQLPDCGYKLGIRYGILWMEKTLNTWDAPPNAPLPVNQLINL